MVKKCAILVVITHFRSRSEGVNPPFSLQNFSFSLQRFAREMKNLCSILVYSILAKSYLHHLSIPRCIGRISFPAKVNPGALKMAKSGHKRSPQKLSLTGLIGLHEFLCKIFKNVDYDVSVKCGIEIIPCF